MGEVSAFPLMERQRKTRFWGMIKMYVIDSAAGQRGVRSNRDVISAASSFTNRADDWPAAITDLGGGR